MRPFCSGYPSGWSIVAEVMDTCEPAVIEVVLRFRSAPEVPTDPCATAVPPTWVRIRKYPAVPELFADESGVIAANVARAPGLVSEMPEKTVALLLVVVIQ